MIRRGRKALGWLALILVLGYAALVLAMNAYQRDLIYPDIAAQPAKPGFAEIALQTSDGLILKAGYRPPAPGMPTLVFFHGNAMVWPQSTCCTELAGQAGVGLLLAEYRGYNGNPGEPSEEGLYRDGRAALAWLAAQGTPPEQTVLVGYSLGSGVATQMAREISPRALILLSAYSRMGDAAAARYPFLPVDWLLKDRFDNVSKIAGVTAPVLLIHGDADEIVPFAQAQALAAAQPAARLLVLPRGGHHDAADSTQMQGRQLEFLRSIGVWGKAG